MPTQNLDLSLRIRADMADALRGIDRVERGLVSTGRVSDRAARSTRRYAAAADRTSQSLTAMTSHLRLASIAAGAIAAVRLVQFVGDTTRAAVAAESLASAMLAATGSATAATAELAFVGRVSRRLGIDLAGAEAAYVQLAAAARGTVLEGQGARDIFVAVAEAARVMGLSAEQQSGALTAIQQIISKGVVSAEELRGQLGERLPGAFQIAARAMGVTTAELGKMLEKGEVLAEDLLPRLAQELRASVADGLSAATNSNAAAIARLDTAILDLQRSMGGLADTAGILASWSASAIRYITRVGESLGLLRERTEALTAAEALDRIRDLVTARKDLRTEIQNLAQAEQSGIGGSGVRKQATSLAAVKIAALNRRIEDLIEIVYPNRGRFNGGDPPPPLNLPPRVKDDESSSAGASAVERYLLSLRRRIDATHELSAVQRVQSEIERGQLREATAADRRRALALAERLDLAAADAQARKQLIDDEGAALDLATRTAAQRRDAHDAAVARIETERLTLDDATRSPYARAVAEVERWRDSVLAGLDDANAGYVAHAAQVDEIVRGRISAAWAEFGEARRRASTEWRVGAERALESLSATTTDAADTAERSLTGAFRGAEDALTQFAVTGKLSFRGLANSIIADLARIAIRQAITGPIAAAFSGLFSPTSNAGAFANLPGGLSTPTLHTGGLVGQLGGVRRRGIPPSVFVGAPRFHRGGIAGLRDDEVPIIAQAGERVLSRAETRALERGGQPEIHIEFTNRGTPQQEVSRTAGFDGRAWVVGVVVDDIGRNGPIRGAIQGAGTVI